MEIHDFWQENGNFLHANADFLQENDKFPHANGDFLQENGEFLHANGDFLRADAEFLHANSVFLQENPEFLHADGDFRQENGVRQMAGGLLTVIGPPDYLASALRNTAPNRLMTSRILSTLALPKLMRISLSGFLRDGSSA